MKSNKLYVIGAVILLVGMILCAVGCVGVGFDFSAFGSSEEYTELSYKATLPVETFNITDDNVDVFFVRSADEDFHVTYFESENHRYNVSEKDGILSFVKHSDWSFSINFGVRQRVKVTVEVPAGYNGNLNAHTDNGDIDFYGISANEIAADIANSSISMTSVRAAGKITAETDNGRVVMNDVETDGNILAETNNGRIILTNVKANSITAEGNNAKLELDRVVAMDTIELDTDNGAISLDTVEFGTALVCEVDNGSIRGTVVGAYDDFIVDSDVDNGKCTTPVNNIHGRKSIKATASNGDIEISTVDPVN